MSTAGPTEIDTSGASATENPKAGKGLKLRDGVVPTFESVLLKMRELEIFDPTSPRSRGKAA